MLIAIVSNSHLLVVILASAVADCPSDSVWPTTLVGATAEAACQGDTTGEMTRVCNAVSGTWDEPDTEYCLPKYPEDGYANVDFILLIMYGNVERIRRNTTGIIVGITTAISTVDGSNIAIHRIANNTSGYVSVQVRVTDAKNTANSFYRQLNDDFRASLLTYFRDNNERRLKYHYLNDPDRATVLFKSTPSYQEARPKNTGATVIIIVCVIIGVIVLAIVGFYVWLQIKRSTTKNGSKQLKNTSKV